MLGLFKKYIINANSIKPSKILEELKSHSFEGDYLAVKVNNAKEIKRSVKFTIGNFWEKHLTLRYEVQLKFDEQEYEKRKELVIKQIIVSGRNTMYLKELKADLESLVR